MRSRNRLAGLAAVTAGLALVTGCTTSVEGQAVPTGGGSGGHTADGASCVPANLMSCMMKAPSGSKPFTQPFAPNGPITTAQFLKEFYPDDATQYDGQIAQELSEDGVQAIVHQDWHASNDDQAEVVLLRFADGDGAHSRLETAVQGADGDDTYTPVDVSAAGVKAYVSNSPDSLGNLVVQAYATAGSVEMEFNFYSPDALDKPTMNTWVSQEVALMNTQD
jgi:hypothetical protein